MESGGHEVSKMSGVVSLRSAVAAQKRRYCYRRIHVLLQREGWLTNH
jgi:hypothetical protein